MRSPQWAPEPMDAAAMNGEAGVVLIVDDAPQNLAMLHEALDSAGYRVMVATDGRSAIERVARLQPDLILLDALMPGLDGFETCRRLKADPQAAHIPVVFMTGLTDTEHILIGFRAGGVDYVTKPVEPSEVLARMATHLRNARTTAHAQQAVEATGHAMLFIDASGRLAWQSPAARQWLAPCLDGDGQLPPTVRAWLMEPMGTEHALRTSADGAPLVLSRLASDAGGSTLLLRKRAATAEPAALVQRFSLTAREADVLYWVACGKTNRDVAEILHMSPRTVDKHLQHVFAKLNVETRTAAASLALDRDGAAARL